MKYLTTIDGQTFEVEINKDGKVTINGEERVVDFQTISPSLVSALIDHHSHEAMVETHEDHLTVLLNGALYEVQVVDERQQRLRESTGGMEVGQGELSIRSPMPGLIVTVNVSEGQQVEQGESLCVLELMKMENEIKAPRAGTVAHVYVNKGDRVEQNKALITLV